MKNTPSDLRTQRGKKREIIMTTSYYLYTHSDQNSLHCNNNVIFPFVSNLPLVGFN